MTFGRWVEQRERAQEEYDPPKNRKAKAYRPKYTTRAQMLGIVDGMPGTETPEPARPHEEQRQIERFRRDPDALADYLGLDD